VFDPAGLPPWLRWTAWGVFALLWTIALLATFPVTARDAVLAPSEGFTAGKTLHVLAYALFAMLTAWLPASSSTRWTLLGFVSFHAFATEFLQQFVNRTPSIADIGLDHVGIVLGFVSTWKRWTEASQ
jgi:VanZ family protein